MDTFLPLKQSYWLLRLYGQRWPIEAAWDSAVLAAPPSPLDSPAWALCRAAGRQGRQSRREPRHFLSPSWTDCPPFLPYSSPANQRSKMSNKWFVPRKQWNLAFTSMKISNIVLLRPNCYILNILKSAANPQTQETMVGSTVPPLSQPEKIF